MVQIRPPTNGAALHKTAQLSQARKKKQCCGSSKTCHFTRLYIYLYVYYGAATRRRKKESKCFYCFFFKPHYFALPLAIVFLAPQSHTLTHSAESTKTKRKTEGCFPHQLAKQPRCPLKHVTCAILSCFLCHTRRAATEKQKHSKKKKVNRLMEHVAYSRFMGSTFLFLFFFYISVAIALIEQSSEGNIIGETLLKRIEKALKRGKKETTGHPL